MPGIVAVQTSQAELAAIAVVLGLACVGGALVARTRAPAVSMGLVTGLIIGVITLLISAREGQHGVPILVLMFASTGLAASGIVALYFVPAHVPTGSLRRAAVATAAIAPLVGLMALFAMQDACPLYVTRGSGFCHYNEDVLGGWTAAAAVIISLDLLVIALLLWITAIRASHADLDAARNEDLFVRPRM